MKYGYATIKGKRPKNKKCENQDAYIVHENLFGEIHLFAVCDGHGTNGGLCSKMVKEKLPILLIKELEKQSYNIGEAILNVCNLLHESLKT